MPRVTIYEGKGKKSGQPFTALKVEVGKYSALMFPSEIEMDYIKRKIKEENAEESKFNLDEE